MKKKISKFELYKKLLPWIIAYMLIFMYFYLIKLTRIHTLYPWINPQIFAFVISIFSVGVFFGIIYLIIKSGGFNTLKNRYIKSRKRMFLELFLIVLAIVGATFFQYFLLGEPAKPWTYSSDEGGYSILFIGDLQNETKIVPAGLEYGKLYLTGSVNNGVSYVVLYLDYSKSYLDQVDINYMYEEVKRLTIKNSNGKLLEERKIKLGKYDGREILVKNKEDSVTKIRYYLVGKRLYQTIVVTEENKIDSDAVNNFFDSFKFTKE